MINCSVGQLGDYKYLISFHKIKIDYGECLKHLKIKCKHFFLPNCTFLGTLLK